MLMMILAGIATAAVGTGACLDLRARLARSRRLYDGVFFARRVRQGGPAGPVFRRSSP